MDGRNGLENVVVEVLWIVYYELKQRGFKVNYMDIVDKSLMKSISKDLKITLYAAFREMEDFIGLEMVERMCQLS